MNGVANYISAYSIVSYGFLWRCRDFMVTTYLPDIWAYKERNIFHSLLEYRFSVRSRSDKCKNLPRA